MMLTQPALEKLHDMRLTGMAEAYASQLDTPDVHELSFDERFGLLVDFEATYRQNRRLARLLKEAKLRLPACPEDIDYRHSRGLDRAVMRALASCQWLQARQNVLITGPTGAGKTYLACALAHAACRNGFRARYYRVPRLLADLGIAKADGSLPKLLDRLVRADLLVLDDWALAPLNGSEGRDMLEILDDRSESRSTLVASQVPVASWHDTIQDPTVADAILDRLVHKTHKIELKGESMRKIANQSDQ